MATLVKAWGNEKGHGLLPQALRDEAGRAQGARASRELIAAGEVPVGLTVYNSNVESLRKRGAPIDFVPCSPWPRDPRASASRRTPPPARGAPLRRIRASLPKASSSSSPWAACPASTKVKSHLNNFPFTLIDPVTILDESDKWGKTWDELFLRK
jgi:iron(III) transport system substrate-binding protein